MYVCVCERERGREKERKRDKVPEKIYEWETKESGKRESLEIAVVLSSMQIKCFGNRFLERYLSEL